MSKLTEKEHELYLELIKAREENDELSTQISTLIETVKQLEFQLVALGAGRHQ